MFGVALACAPLFASADVSTSTVPVPVPVQVSPLDGATLKTSDFLNVTWSSVMVGSTSASYNYESALSASTTQDGSFVTPVFVSPLLASSTISTAGTSEGTYYWHVRAVSSTGGTSTWSTPWKVIVDNTAPTAPGAPVLVSSVSPTSSTTAGVQVWSFTTSSDTLSGVARYEYNLNGTTTWIANALNTSITTNLGIGTYSIAVRSVDNAGNVSMAASSSFTVTASSTSATSTPVVTPTPTTANQCKKMGWKSFTNPSFKNQGRCVSYVEKMLRDKKKEDNKAKQELNKKVKEARNAATHREKEINEKAKNGRSSEHEDNEHNSTSTVTMSDSSKNKGSDHAENGNQNKENKGRGHGRGN